MRCALLGGVQKVLKETSASGREVRGKAERRGLSGRRRGWSEGGACPGGPEGGGVSGWAGGRRVRAGRKEACPGGPVGGAYLGGPEGACPVGLDGGGVFGRAGRRRCVQAGRRAGACPGGPEGGACLSRAFTYLDAASSSYFRRSSSSSVCVAFNAGRK